MEDMVKESILGEFNFFLSTPLSEDSKVKMTFKYYIKEKVYSTLIFRQTKMS